MEPAIGLFAIDRGVTFQGMTSDLMGHTSQAPLAARVAPNTEIPSLKSLHLKNTKLGSPKPGVLICVKV